MRDISYTREIPGYLRVSLIAYFLLKAPFSQTVYYFFLSQLEQLYMCNLMNRAAGITL